MEILLFIGIIAAAVFSYNLGVKEGEKQTMRIIEQASHRGMNPENAFARAYGRPGFYFYDLHSDLNAGPLAVTSSADFLRLVAQERLGYEANPNDLKATIERMTDSYHLATGYTPEKLAAMKEISKQFYKNEDDT